MPPYIRVATPEPNRATGSIAAGPRCQTASARGFARCIFLALAALALLPLLEACSVVPDWSKRQAREESVIVSYGPRSDETRIRLPASTRDLLVFELEVDPANVRHTFAGEDHFLHVGARPVTVRCRYRQFRTFGSDGAPRPWLEPQDIFPGAKRIVRN